MVHKIVIEPLGPLQRKFAEGWIPHFTEVFRLRQELGARGMRTDDVEEALDVVINNLEDDLHGRLEHHGIPFLAALRSAERGVFSDDERSAAYMWYLADQYMRTPRIQRDVTDSVRNMGLLNIDASFGLIRTVLTSNLAYSFFATRRTMSLTFLHASERMFITGDQPLVNLRVGRDGRPPDEVELYYPLSPSLGVLFDFDTKEPLATERTLSPDETETYNRVIVDAAHEQVYGADRDNLPHSRNR